jgi:hypothetical protein
MKTPQTMRILTKTFPQFDTRLLDVLTGKTMKLEDDGGTVVETVYEDSESDSDFEFPVLQIPDDEFDDFLFD